MKQRKVRDSLQKRFPQCVVPWLTDTEYDIPTPDQLRAAVADCVEVDGRFEPERNDCDDFALHLHSAVKKWVRDTTTGYQWPFGEVFVPGHNQNACLTTDGWYMVEPQTGAIWKADNDTVIMFKG
jgi:hypothetical protein